MTNIPMPVVSTPVLSSNYIFTTWWEAVLIGIIIGMIIGIFLGYFIKHIKIEDIKLRSLSMICPVIFKKE